MKNYPGPVIGRRAVLQGGSLLMLSAGLPGSLPAVEDTGKRKLRLGLVTDMHYADKPAAGSRHYRETLGKLAEAAERFRVEQVEMVVELGDFIDAADSVQAEKKHLGQVHKAFSEIPGDKHYVLGNHCVHTLTKAEFLDGVHQKKSFYSFTAGGVHCIVLDACFRSDGTAYGRKNFQWTDPNIPSEQVEWLQADLGKAKDPVIVFVHQRLDVSNHYGVKNAPAVRKVLEDSGKVLAVFQGHSHKNEHREINGIHYTVLTAMVEGAGEQNNGYSTLDVFADGSLRLHGFRKQATYGWS